MLRSVSLNARFFIFTDNSRSNSLSLYFANVTNAQVQIQTSYSNESHILTSKVTFKLNQSEKFRKKISTSKIIFFLRSKKIHFEVDTSKKKIKSKKCKIFQNREFLIYNNISGSNRLRGIQKTCSRDHRKQKSRNNHFAS